MARPLTACIGLLLVLCIASAPGSQSLGGWGLVDNLASVQAGNQNGGSSGQRKTIQSDWRKEAPNKAAPVTPLPARAKAPGSPVAEKPHAVHPMAGWRRYRDGRCAYYGKISNCPAELSSQPAPGEPYSETAVPAEQRGSRPQPLASRILPRGEQQQQLLLRDARREEAMPRRANAWSEQHEQQEPRHAERRAVSNSDGLYADEQQQQQRNTPRSMADAPEPRREQTREETREQKQQQEPKRSQMEPKMDDMADINNLLFAKVVPDHKQQQQPSKAAQQLDDGLLISKMPATGGSTQQPAAPKQPEKQSDSLLMDLFMASDSKVAKASASKQKDATVAVASINGIPRGSATANIASATSVMAKPTKPHGYHKYHAKTARYAGGPKGKKPSSYKPSYSHDDYHNKHPSYAHEDYYSHQPGAYEGPYHPYDGATPYHPYDGPHHPYGGPNEPHYPPTGPYYRPPGGYPGAHYYPEQHPDYATVKTEEPEEQAAAGDDSKPAEGSSRNEALKKGWTSLKQKLGNLIQAGDWRGSSTTTKAPAAAGEAPKEAWHTKVPEPVVAPPAWIKQVPEPTGKPAAPKVDVPAVAAPAKPEQKPAAADPFQQPIKAAEPAKQSEQKPAAVAPVAAKQPEQKPAAVAPVAAKQPEQKPATVAPVAAKQPEQKPATVAPVAAKQPEQKPATVAPVAAKQPEQKPATVAPVAAKQPEQKPAAVAPVAAKQPEQKAAEKPAAAAPVATDKAATKPEEKKPQQQQQAAAAAPNADKKP